MNDKNKASIEDKKYLAKVLFTSEKLEQKVIAARVGVSEKTLSKWVHEGEWKALRNRLLISKEHQINMLYHQLEALNKLIEANDTKHADTRQADILIKLTAAVRNLETDLAIADLVASGMRFIKYIQHHSDTKQVIDIADLWNSFIHSEIKK